MIITLKRYQKLLSSGFDIDKNGTDHLHSARRIRVRQLADIPFSKFVDLERCIEDSDYINFCNIFVKRLRFSVRFLCMHREFALSFQFVTFHNIKNIMQQYADQKEELYLNYHFLFDPPQYGEPEKVTPGSELRQEFVEEFGSWVILTDVVMRWCNVGFKEVENWKTSEFLFWANYLTGQKIIENVK